MKCYTAVIAPFLQNTFFQHFSWIPTEISCFLQLTLLLTKIPVWEMPNPILY